MSARRPVFVAWALAVVLLVADGAAATTAVADDVDGTARISGLVTLPDGVTGRSWVIAYSEDGSDVRADTVAADGSYSIGALRGGDYRILFDTEATGAIEEWWDDQRDRASATVVTVAPGGSVSGIDATLPAAGSIAGRVTFPAGFDTSAGYTRVRAYTSSTAYSAEAIVDPDGNYVLRGLRTGSYRIAFESFGRSLLTRFAGGAYDYADAQRIPATDDVAVTGIDIVLTDGASVSGSVSYPAGWEDRVFPARATLRDVGRAKVIGSVDVQEDGSYRFEVLKPGSYAVTVVPADDALYRGRWGGGWSDDPPTFTVAEDEDRVGIDVALEPSATLSGRVVFPAGMAVPAGAEVRVGDGDVWTSPIAEDGSYRIDGLNAGWHTLYVRADTSAVSDRWYGEAPRGTAVPVDWGEQVTGLDIVMRETATLGGRIVFGEGTRPADGSSTVRLYTETSPFIPVRSVEVDASGVWRMDGVDAGTYRVRIDTEGQGALDRWMGGSRHANATSFALAPAQSRLDLEAELVASASLSGRVTLAPGNVIHAGRLDVEATTVIDGWRTTFPAEVSVDGTFVISDLPAGEYEVTARNGAGYLPATWEQTVGGEVVRTMSIATGESRTEVDLRIRTASSISLTPRTAILYGRSVFVVLHRVDDGPSSYPVGYESSPPFLNLPAGDYKLSIRGAGLEAWYGGEDEQSATVLSLAEGQNLDLGVVDALGFEAALAAPTIRGEFRQQYRLYADWSLPQWPDEVAFAYQWLVDGEPRAGATTEDFVIPNGDLGKRISVRVTASAPGYLDTTRESLISDPVKLPAVRLYSAYLQGVAAVGKTLTAVAHEYDSSAQLRYRWYANGVPIPGATARTLVLSSAHLGDRISAEVIASRSGYDATSRTSPQSSSVAAGTLTAPTPAIVGAAVVGSKLTVSRGTWTSGTAITYRWYADGKAISGATGSTLTLPLSLRSRAITVTVTGKKSGYTTVAKSSRPTARVMRAGTPTISGTAAVGKRLVAAPGTWTTGTTLRYQWYANGVRITGATSSTWTLKSSQRGKIIKVRVVGSKSGYTTVSSVSKATPRVR